MTGLTSSPDCTIAAILYQVSNIHHVARAHLLADRHRHDADRAGAGDQDVLAHHVVGQRGMNGVAERVEDRRDVV
jgi:hypothetical protein